MTEGHRPSLRALRELARENGVQTSYLDTASRRRVASEAALLGTLGALGVPVTRPEDAAAALEDLRRARRDRLIEPVIVAPRGRLSFAVTLPARRASDRITWQLVTESGEERAGEEKGRASSSSHDPIVVGERLPAGYHVLRVAAGEAAAQALVIATPWERPRDDGRRGWGVFLPLYALRSERSWGVGDFTDLAELAEWTGGLGGETVATLPLLAAFLDEPFEPSPYSPASRLFWNELYLDVAGVPELTGSPKARAQLSSRFVTETMRELNRLPLVDYRRAMWSKRKVLEAMSESFFERPDGARWESFRRFLATKPNVEHYARFRAAGEAHRAPWTAWPARERAGRLPPAGGNRPAFRYHQYVQWLAAQQMADLAARARRAGTGLYFDMPLGVNSASFDVWQERRVFALEAAAGAPPDQFRPGGQNWGFFPLHPQRVREQGYRYPIACLRHVLSHANVLRIDHAMSLHRLYWVPQGLDTADGAYVRYPWRELYAILDVETRRAGAVIVGEDLGTVAAEVRVAMARHGVHRLYVLPFEVTPDPRQAICPPPRRSFAGLNTHDMAPFAGYWRGQDIDLAEKMGWVDRAEAKADRTMRQRQRVAVVSFLRRRGHLPAKGAVRTRDVLSACLTHLSDGVARMVVVNLEDLWLETRPQNVPGTTDEYPNWRRVARHPLERIRRLPTVLATLRRIHATRKGMTPR